MSEHDQSCDGGRVEPPIETSAHTLRFLGSMEAMLSTIEAAVDEARSRVMIETYIYRDDKLGRSFGERMMRAAQRGVQVRLVADPLGSQETDQKFFDELRAGGVDVRMYRSPRQVPSKPFPRDHGRVMVVDGQAWTGGMAWADAWLPKARGGVGWYDVCVQVLRGPVIEDFVHVFETRWEEALGPDAPCDVDTKDKYPDVRLLADCPAPTTLVYSEHRRKFQSAKQRIWVENAYFFPPQPMLQDLVDAVRRGVDVRIVMPKDSDLKIVEKAARSEYGEWIRHGLRIFEYTRCMLHSKFAVVDDDWTTIGTFNANPTSLALANEVNLVVCDKRFVARAAQQIESDLKDCEEVTLESWGKRSLGRAVQDRLAADALNIGDMLAGKEDEPCRSSQS